MIDSTDAWEACKFFMQVAGTLGFVLGFVVRDRFWDIKPKKKIARGRHAKIYQFPSGEG